MRAAGLLPLLPLLLLHGVSSQDDSVSARPGQTTIAVTTEITTPTTSATTAGASPTTSATTTTAETTTTTTTTTEGATQPPVTTTTTTQSTTPAQTTTTTTANLGNSPSAATSPAAVLDTTPTTSGSTLSATTTSSHTSGQDSSSHSASTPTTTPAASSTTSQQPGSATASSGSSGATSAANAVLTNGASPPGAVGAAGTSSPTQPQGNQPLDPFPNTTVSITALRTDPSQSSKDCADPPPLCPTKQPPSSSSSPAQGPTSFPTPRSINTSVTPLTGSPSLATTKTSPMSQPGSKDTVSEAAPTTSPGADQSTRDAGSASAKPTSASQSPARAQPSAPAAGDQTNQTGSCSPELLPHRNLSFRNELICEDGVQLTRPTIHLREAKTCDYWRKASNNTSFFVSFCSTAQRAFDADRDGCTVKLTACKKQSHDWAVQVVLHLPLDSEEVLQELREKDKLEELGIINITSDKMVEDMTINDEFSTPLIITIITLAVSLLLIAAIYGCYQRFSHKKDQNIHPDVPGFDDGHVALIFNQRLTEEMQTMENGYHDNPTLEVMETSSEMQEKKVNLNGELGDSWIVPLDTLMKEDLEEEEDTHL